MNLNRIVMIAEKPDGSMVYAKSDCKKCHGRGYLGFSRPVKNSNVNTKIGPVICRCVFAVNAPKAPEPTPVENPIKKPLLGRMFSNMKNRLTKSVAK